MTSSTSDHGPQAADPEPPLWVERRWFTGMQAVLLTLIIVVPAFLLRRDGATGADLRLTAVVFGAFFLFMLAICVSPLTVGFGHLRIDRKGLAVWWGGLMKVPIEQLGDAMIVPPEEVGPAARRGRYREIKIPVGHSSCWAGGQSEPAVFVEQHRPDGKTVGWLLATREPEVVVEALAEVRDGRRDG